MLNELKISNTQRTNNIIRFNSLESVEKVNKKLQNAYLAQSKFATNFLDKTLEEEKRREDLISEKEKKEREQEEEEDDMDVTPSSVLKVHVETKKKI